MKKKSSSPAKKPKPSSAKKQSSSPAKKSISKVKKSALSAKKPIAARAKKQISSPANQSRLDVMVLLDESDQSNPGERKELMSSLKKIGFKMTQPELREISVLTGSIPATAEADIAKVAGVAGVERVRDDYTTQ